MDRSALERLEVFVGRWALEARFEHMPDVGITGSAELQWILGGAFLSMTSQVSHPQAPSTYSIIAPSSAPNEYTQHFFDSRGVVRTYAMTFDGTTWTLTREQADFTALDFKQRFVGTLEDGGNTIRGRWDIDNGAGYVRDFDLMFRRER